MSLEDDLREFMKESREKREVDREFRGQMTEYMKNTSEHITAVSKKADAVRKELQDHAGDQSIHVTIRSLGLILVLFSTIGGLVFWNLK